MITFKSVAELETALRAAEAAHKVAEQEGHLPMEWPTFYARYMAEYSILGGDRIDTAED